MWTPFYAFVLSRLRPPSSLATPLALPLFSARSKVVPTLKRVIRSCSNFNFSRFFVAPTHPCGVGAKGGISRMSRAGRYCCGTVVVAVPNLRRQACSCVFINRRLIPTNLLPKRDTHHVLPYLRLVDKVPGWRHVIMKNVYSAVDALSHLLILRPTLLEECCTASSVIPN